MLFWPKWTLVLVCFVLFVRQRCHQFISNAFAAGKPFGGRPSAISYDRAKRGRARRALPFGLVGLGTLNRKEGGKEEKKREEKKKEKRDEKMPDRP